MTICYRSEESCCVCLTSSIDPTPVRAAIVPWSLPICPPLLPKPSDGPLCCSLVLQPISRLAETSNEQKKTKKNWRAAAHGPVLYRFVFFSLIPFWIWEIDEMLAGVIHPKQQLSEMDLRIEEGRLPKNKIPVVKWLKGRRGSKVVWLFCGRMRRNLQIWSNIIWLQLLKFSRYHQYFFYFHLKKCLLYHFLL